MYSEAGRLFLSHSVREEIHHRHIEMSRHSHLCSLVGLFLGCSLFSPHTGPQRGSLCPASTGESRNILQTSRESLAHPCSPIFLPFSSVPLSSAQAGVNGAGMSRPKMLSDDKALSAKAMCTLDGSWRAPSSSPPCGSRPLPCVPLQPVKCGQFLIAPTLEGGYNSASF